VTWRSAYRWSCASRPRSGTPAPAARGLASRPRARGAAPGAAPTGFYGVLKVAGTTFEPLRHPVSTVVLLDAKNREVERLPVSRDGQLTNPQVDIEALLFTASSVDKYAIPYLSRVLGAEFAAAQRRKWIKD